MLWVIGMPVSTYSGVVSATIKIYRGSTLLSSGSISVAGGSAVGGVAASFDGSHTTNQRFKVTFTGRDSGFVFRGMLAVFVAKR